VTYLLDSDRVGDFLKGRDDAGDLFRAIQPMGLSISVITYGEIYDGVMHGRDPQGAVASFRQFVQGVRVLDVTAASAEVFGAIRGDLRQRGQRIPDSDLLIAATALHHRLTLVTRNLRHFTRIPGLSIYQEP
jgi:predicted nucleic acid-binding protein